jgi:hypothetical protein
LKFNPEITILLPNKGSAKDQKYPSGLKPFNVSLNLMRTFIILLMLFVCNSALCQELSLYRDTSYQFEVGVPVGWRYGKPKSYPNLLLISIRNPVDTTEKFVENFNVNVVKEPNSSIDSAFMRMLSFNEKTNDFQVLEQGSKTISGQSFKWVISTHTNKFANQKMYNYVLLTYKENSAYILTFVSTPKNFELYLPFFERIAETFRLKNFS